MVYDRLEDDLFRTIEMDVVVGEILQREHEKQLRARQYYGERYTQLFVSVDGIINTTGEGNEILLVAVREDGTYIGPRTMQHASGVIHHELGYPEFTFHSLRHTHATMLVESGAPIKYVQERLGHKDAHITYMENLLTFESKQKSDGRALIDKIFLYNLLLNGAKRVWWTCTNSMNKLKTKVQFLVRITGLEPDGHPRFRLSLARLPIPAISANSRRFAGRKNTWFVHA